MQCVGRALVLGASCAMLWPGPGPGAFGQRPEPFGFNSPLGAYPCAQLTWGTDGTLCGTTYGGGESGSGAVFKLNADGTGYTVLHSFAASGREGAYPGASLVEGWDGALYGTTASGGGGGYGPVFRLNPQGTNYTVLYSFCGTEGDGAYPAALVVQGWDGALYGTTYSGGSVGAGTVFKLNLDGTDYSVLHSFNVEDGALPCAPLYHGWDGLLYGTTYSGGSNNVGTVFRLNPDGTGYTVLHSFTLDGVDGAYPYSPVVQGWDWALYGTTSSGGGNNAGTVFRLNADGTGYTVLHSFARDGTDGTCPYSAVVHGWDWTLYGTTLFGGSHKAGTLFKLNTDGSGYTVLRAFSPRGADGAYPYSALVQGSDGWLYGTTVIGGSQNAGTVFRLNADGSGFAVLHSFEVECEVEVADGVNVTSPRLTTVTLLPDKNLQLTLVGASNLVWRVQAATDLVEPRAWETVAYVFSAEGQVQFTDLNATNYPQRYYRAVWP
jgi:uncharacterized repeat protein (TIGR03803 family)